MRKPFVGKYLTLEEAAEFLGLSYPRVWQLLRAGKLGKYRRKRVLERGEVEKVAKERKRWAR